jgi:hypothetical protein
MSGDDCGAVLPGAGPPDHHAARLVSVSGWHVQGSSGIESFWDHGAEMPIDGMITQVGRTREIGSGLGAAARSGAAAVAGGGSGGGGGTRGRAPAMKPAPARASATQMLPMMAWHHCARGSYRVLQLVLRTVMSAQYFAGVMMSCSSSTMHSSPNVSWLSFSRQDRGLGWM